MNSDKPAEPDSLPLSPRVLCPYLRKRNDADTFSAGSELPNYCHKANPNAPVSIEHQMLICTSEEYMNCPVFNATQPPVLPAEWLNVDAFIEGKTISQRQTTVRSLTYIGIGLATLVILWIVFQSWFTGSVFNLPVDQASNQPTLPRTITLTSSLVPSLTLYPSAILVFNATPDSSQNQQAINQMQTATAATGQAIQPVVIPAGTGTPALTLTNCTVEIFDQVYSPAVFHPPLVVMYDSTIFLIKWKVVNTSADCVWTTMQLLTVVDNEQRMLNMMPTGREQPVIDEDFVILDGNIVVNRVAPGQIVTIVIQINGLDLVYSNGKIDRFYDMIINGQLVPQGRLVAQQEQWAVVSKATRTPTAINPSTHQPSQVNPSATPGRPTSAVPTSAVPTSAAPSPTKQLPPTATVPLPPTETATQPLP